MQTGDSQPWHIAWEDTAWTPDELFKVRTLLKSLLSYWGASLLALHSQGGMCYFLCICHIRKTWWSLMQVTVQAAGQRFVIGSSSKPPACRAVLVCLSVFTRCDEVLAARRRGRAAGACLWGRRLLQRTGTSATLRSSWRRTRSWSGDEPSDASLQISTTWGLSHAWSRVGRTVWERLSPVYCNLPSGGWHSRAFGSAGRL